MKKILTSIALLFALTSFGQTVDTSIHDCTCAAVNNLTISHGFPIVTDTINHIGFFNYTDSPRDTSCVVNFTVKANSNFQNVIFNTYTLTKNEYANWVTDNDLIVDIKNYLQRSGITLTFK
jgi:hypothetical protein